jgi:hypothetical protein
MPTGIKVGWTRIVENWTEKTAQPANPNAQKIIDVVPEKVEILDIPIKQPDSAPQFRIHTDHADLFRSALFMGFPVVIGPGYVAPARQPQCTPGLPGPQKAF